MKLANPAPLGLCGFALTTWMLSMMNAGWFTGTSAPLVLAIAFGGAAQFAASLMELPRGNTFGFVAFCAYGAFWWSFALLVQFYPATVPPAFIGWWLVMWGVFTTIMWVASLALNRALQMIFLALLVTFYPLGISDLFAMPALHQLGGYMGFVTAVLAFYLAAAEIINETHGRAVLPVGLPTVNLAGLQSRPA